ncbi:hypothetical protein [Paraburkholderia sacchari]|uniref:hypothetical protein n=1 Tax=Paraburkholderia sacchari TaxID=159450 RepID=UPI001BCF96B7|nr:hypothetical protein [Paraburkholderia sacchari]
MALGITSDANRRNSAPYTVTDIDQTSDSAIFTHHGGGVTAFACNYMAVRVARQRVAVHCRVENSHAISSPEID